MIPTGLREFLSIQMDGGGAVQAGKKSQKQVGIRPPRLTAVVTQVLHLKPHFLHHFPADRIFCRLSDLRKPGDQRVSLVVPSLVAGHQDLIPAGHRDDHSRGDLGIDQVAALWATKHPFYQVRLGPLPALTTESVGSVPLRQMIGCGFREAEDAGFFAPLMAQVVPLISLRAF